MPEKSQIIESKSLNLVRNSKEAGFSLIEAIIAIIILAVVLLGVASLFAFGTRTNSGNNTRSQMLAVLQQQVEVFRAAKFTPLVTDAVMAGGEKAEVTLPPVENRRYKVKVWIDDDPFISGYQTDNTKTLKEITVRVSGPFTETGLAVAPPITTVFRRVRSN